MTIDTVKLHLTDYSITADSNLVVQPATYNAGTGEVLHEFPLFRNDGGKIFNGSKAYLNTERLNLTLQPFTKGNSLTSCFVQFSIPKIHNGNNFYSVGENGCQAVIGMVEGELAENGIRTDLYQADISRIDTFKNIQAEENYTSYYSLFALLKARKAIQRGYGTTFLVHNTQQQFCIYDKNVEMQSRGIDISQFPENTIRFEHRLLNKGKCQKVYGFSKVDDLFKGGYEMVKTKQVEEWRKSLFSHTPDEVVTLGARELESEMLYFKNKYEKYWLEWFLKAYGAYHLAQVAGVEVIKIALKNVESERTKVWRYEKMLDEVKKEIDFLKNVPGTDKTLAHLYQELKDKVCLN
jgi:hypothetical protein